MAFLKHDVRSLLYRRVPKVLPAVGSLLRLQLQPGSTPNHETSRSCAVAKRLARGRALRGLLQRAEDLMLLRCSSLRHAGLARGVYRWRKKVAPDRKHRFRRGYMERRIEQLEKVAEEEDEKAMAIFSTISTGLAVQLLERQEQPPPRPNTAAHDVNVSDPSEMLAAKLAAGRLRGGGDVSAISSGGRTYFHHAAHR